MRLSPPTDWCVTRQVEKNALVPTELGVWRQEIQDAARLKGGNVLKVDTKEEYLFWPDQPQV
jgi:hypothetical protein